MKTKTRIGAVLAILALCALLPAAFHVNLIPALMALGLVGTATLTYASFLDGSGAHQGYAGGTVAPTTAQVATVNAVVASVAFADADTIATFTHNFGLTAAQAACLQPYLQWYNDGTSLGTVAPFFTFTRTTNVITINKTSVVGSNCTIIVIVRRPMSASA